MLVTVWWDGLLMTSFSRCRLVWLWMTALVVDGPAQHAKQPNET